MTRTTSTKNQNGRRNGNRRTRKSRNVRVAKPVDTAAAVAAAVTEATGTPVVMTDGTNGGPAAVAQLGDVGWLVTLTSRAISEKWPDDPSKPGIQIAHLASGEWYVAIHRYRDRFGGERFVATKAKNTSLAAALREIAGAVSPGHQYQDMLARYLQAAG